MNSYNLRFGPATSDRQIEIYARLVPILTAIRDDVKDDTVVANGPRPVRSRPEVGCETGVQADDLVRTRGAFSLAVTTLPTGQIGSGRTGRRHGEYEPAEPFMGS